MTKTDIKAVLIAVFASTITGMGSAYLTATSTLQAVSTEQKTIEVRVNKLESSLNKQRDSVGFLTTELRVLNVRLEGLQAVGKAVERVEAKVDAALVRRAKGVP